LHKSRRQIVIQVVEACAATLLLLNVVLYLVMLRPYQNRLAAEQQRFSAARARQHDAQIRVERLEKFQAALPGAGDKVAMFQHDHIAPRRRGFSRAAHLVRHVTEESGARLASVSYKLGSDRGSPLQRLSLEISVDGAFDSLVRFAHGLETADDFVLIRGFAFEPSEGAGLGLQFSVDMYLVP
jgi:hypothetical protein